VNLVHEFYELNEFYEFYAMPRKTGTPKKSGMAFEGHAAASVGCLKES